MPDLTYQISLLKIPVTHIATCADFYRDVLHFTPGFFSEEYGWAQFDAGDLSIALYIPGKGGGDGRVGGSLGFHLQLSAQSFDALAADLLPRGVLVENRIHTGDDGSTFIQVRDPDGNVLNIGRA